jgi:hypothetical protein
MPKDNEEPSQEPGRIVAKPLDEVREARGEKLVAVQRSKLASLRAFRRARADVAFGTLGVVVILLAGVFIFTWEPPTVVEPSVGVDWPTTRTVLLNETVSLKTPDPNKYPPTQTTYENSTTRSVSVVQSNVSAFFVTVFWVDDVGNDNFGGDEVQVTLTAPSGFPLSLPAQRNVAFVGSGMWINFSVPVTDLPTMASVPVATEEEARAYVNANVPPSRNGTGTWTVKIDLMRAGDWYAPGVSRDTPCNDPTERAGLCRRDMGNDVKVLVSIDTYRPVFKPA